MHDIHFRPLTVDAVSYTHLDVYKRQVVSGLLYQIIPVII